MVYTNVLRCCWMNYETLIFSIDYPTNMELLLYIPKNPIP